MKYLSTERRHNQTKSLVARIFGLEVFFIVHGWMFNPKLSFQLCNAVLETEYHVLKMINSFSI